MSPIKTSIIKLLIADDHPIYLQGLERILSYSKNICLLGSARNGKELIDFAKKFKPDVILTDIQMPVMNGIEACRLIKQLLPNISVIGLSSFDEGKMISEMLQAGASGYLLKSANYQEVADAIITVSNGKIYYSPSVAGKIFEMLPKNKNNPSRNTILPQFSQNEKKIIELICNQSTSKLIASELHLSTRTIEEARLKIQTKMKVSNMAGIVVFAIKHGLFKIN